MPNYTYRRDEDPQRCAMRCTEGFTQFQQFSDRALEECPGCGAPVRRVIVPAGALRTANPLVDGAYYSSLARYPGDPEAHASGRDSAKRLFDKRKREGWEVNVGRTESSGDTDLSPREIRKRERRAADNYGM